MGRGQARQKGRPKSESDRLRRIRQAKIKERRNRLRRRAAIVVTLALIVGLGSYLLLSQRGGDMIKVTPRVYDFGVVSQAQGVVTTEVTVENVGQRELMITGMRTSCGCTQVSLIIDGEEGPLFGMHENPVGWRGRLAPGERAGLKVYYDPNVHKQLRGALTREIEIFSNDSQAPVYTMQIKLVQTG